MDEVWVYRSRWQWGDPDYVGLKNLGGGSVKEGKFSITYKFEAV